VNFLTTSIWRSAKVWSWGTLLIRKPLLLKCHFSCDDVLAGSRNPLLYRIVSSQRKRFQCCWKHKKLTISHNSNMRHFTVCWSQIWHRQYEIPRIRQPSVCILSQIIIIRLFSAINAVHYSHVNGDKFSWWDENQIWGIVGMNWWECCMSHISSTPQLRGSWTSSTLNFTNYKPEIKRFEDDIHPYTREIYEQLHDQPARSEFPTQAGLLAKLLRLTRVMAGFRLPEPPGQVCQGCVCLL